MNNIKVIMTTLVLASSVLFTGASFAESHPKMTEDAEMECVTQAELAEMSDDDKANLAAPLCEGDEGDEGEDKSEEAPKTD